MIPDSVVGFLLLFLAALVAGAGWTLGTFLMGAILGALGGMRNRS